MIGGALDHPKVVAREIKSEPLSEEELAELYGYAGSYEALFNKRARMLRERKIDHRDLRETDFRDLLLEHYSFLKRPVVLNAEGILIGNSLKVKAAVRQLLTTLEA